MYFFNSLYVFKFLLFTNFVKVKQEPPQKKGIDDRVTSGQMKGIQYEIHSKNMELQEISRQKYLLFFLFIFYIL